MLTAEDLDDAADDVERYRLKLFLDDDGDQNGKFLSPHAEQDFMAALAYLDLAIINLKRAHYHAMQNQ